VSTAWCCPRLACQSAPSTLTARATNSPAAGAEMLASRQSLFPEDCFKPATMNELSEQQIQAVHPAIASSIEPMNSPAT